MRCQLCNRPLKRLNSIRRKMGDICLRKYRRIIIESQLAIMFTEQKKILIYEKKKGKKK